MFVILVVIKNNNKMTTANITNRFATLIQWLVWFTTGLNQSIKSKRLRLNKNEPRAYSSNPAHLYPTEQVLIDAFAHLHNVSAGNILLTAGGDDGLRIIFNRKSRGNAIIMNPDFPQYQKWSDAFGLSPCLVPLAFPDTEFPREMILRNMDSKTSIVILSTVGNPTGYKIPKGFTEELSSQFPHVLIIVDEVYSNYVDEDYTALATRTDNVIVLRSLSKLGVPGLRIGYLVSTVDTINKLKKFALAHPIAGPCIKPALEIIHHIKNVDRLVANQKAASNFLNVELIKRGYPVIQSPANWLHLNLGSVANKVYKLLSDRGVDVLSQTHPILNGWLRISTPHIEMIQEFLQVFDEIMEQPFFEQDGLMVFHKGKTDMTALTGYHFIAKLFGELVEVDHFNIIYPTQEAFQQQVQNATDNNFKIVECGIYPDDFCSEADGFPANLSMHFASLLSPNGGLIVLASPKNTGDQLSGFLQKRGKRGVHHIAIKVQYLEIQIEKWIAKGFTQTSPVAEDGGIKQCFLTNQFGQIIELIERTEEGTATFTCNNINKLRQSETMEKPKHPNHKIHTNISDVLKGYKSVGMSTPFIAANKCKMLLHPDFINHRIAFIVVDAIRCSSTILAALGADVRAITIMVKGGERGTTPADAQGISKLLGLEFLLGGELNGQPIPEGIIGNSPTETANCKGLANKHLHFQSTNFGGSFTEVSDQIREFISIGGNADIFIASFVNANAVAKKIAASDYDRVYIVCGGFYNCVSLEDDIVGGMILNQLGFDYNDLDDEARMMLFLYRNFDTPEKQFDVLKTNWISSSLGCFGKEADVKTVLTGEGIDQATYQKMAISVPMVQWQNNVPIIFNN